MNSCKINKGAFIISLDTEFAWGKISLTHKREYYHLFASTERVIVRLLNLFKKYDIPVTWAIVGRLLEDIEQPTEHFNNKLSNYFEGKLDNSIYEDLDLNRKDNSFIVRTNLADTILSYNSNHEIATHTYSHIYLSESLDPKYVEEDFKATIDIGKRKGIVYSSIVFPKNIINHLDIIHKYGINCYRGADENWYSDLPSIIKKIARQLDCLLPIAGDVIEAREAIPGLINIPGSVLFRVYHRGFKRFYSANILANKTKQALSKASKQKKIVHLRFHPFNFAYKEDRHFAALESVLKKADQMRSRDILDIHTMQTMNEKILSR
jgi:hypothetical protein